MFILPAQPLCSQDFGWEKIGLEEGLPAVGINQIAEGPGGFYWLATEGAGLVRYDGYRFYSLGTEDFPLLSGLATDADEKLWLYNEGRVWRFAGEQFSEVPLPKNRRLRQISVGSETYALMRDHSLWLLGGDSARQVPLSNELRLLNISHQKDTLYLSSDSALYRYRGGQIEKIAARGPWQFLGPQAALCKGVYYPQFPHLATADSSRRWRGGLQAQGQEFLYDDFQVYHRPLGFWEAITVPADLRLRSLRSIHLSREGVLLAADGNALYKLYPSGERRYSRGLEGPVYALAAHDELIYAATGRGLVSLGSEGVQTVGDEGLCLSLCQHRGQLYFGTEQGLYLREGYRSKKMPWPGEGFVFSLLSQGESLWLGSSQGIWERRGEQWVNHSQEAELPPATVFAAAQANDSSLWFASYTEGLFSYHRGTWRHLQRWGKMALDSLNFSSFWPVSQSEVWLGTANDGLYHLKEKGMEHFRFDELGYAEVRALRMIEGQLWLGTNKGSLSLRELRNHRQEATDDKLPYQGVAVSSNALLSHQNLLWVGGNGQVSALQTQLPHLQQGAQLWQIQLLKESKRDALLAHADSLRPYTQVPLGLRLPHHYNYLSFSYGTSTLLQPQMLRYRYRLLGQSEQWTYAGGRRQAIFTDLKPRDYRLEVQVRRPGETWPSHSEVYAFSIAPPFWQTWWFIALLVLSLGGGTLAFMRDRITRAQQRLRLENELMEMERKALRLQMNPHFIFNALDSISSFIFREEPKQAVRYLNNFAKLMRLTLESSMQHIHPVETEVSILKNYLELEKLRFNKQFDYQIEVDEEIDYDVGMPPMLLQPHVENAILHGLKTKSDGQGFLRISFALKGELLCCTIDDNGIGRKAAKKLARRPDHRSMATQINRDRLALLKQSLNAIVDLKIEDKYSPEGIACGTRVIIRLPAEEI